MKVSAGIWPVISPLYPISKSPVIRAVSPSAGYIIVLCLLMVIICYNGDIQRLQSAVVSAFHYHHGSYPLWKSTLKCRSWRSIPGFQVICTSTVWKSDKGGGELFGKWWENDGWINDVPQPTCLAILRVKLFNEGWRHLRFNKNVCSTSLDNTHRIVITGIQTADLKPWEATQIYIG